MPRWTSAPRAGRPCGSCSCRRCGPRCSRPGCSYSRSRFDDFVLSFFTTGEDMQPLPVRIWSAIRFGLSPTINAIGTLMMVVSLTAIALAVLLPRLFGRRESGFKVLTAQEG